MKLILPKVHIDLERWKYSRKYDCYVSTYGRIRDNNKNLITPGVKDNYLYYKGRLVHRIVLETFAPVPGYAFLTVDHKDKNTKNARLDNLIWLKSEDNVKKAAIEDKLHNPIPLKPIDTTKFFVNGNLMTKNAAIQLMRADKQLDKNANLDRAFEKAYNNIGSNPIKIGMYNILYIKEDGNE